MNLSSYYFMAPRPSEEVGVDTGPNDSLTLYLVSDASRWCSLPLAS